MQQSRATYRWELLQTGATDWYTISNAEGPITTPELTFTAQQGWDGFLWRVALLDVEGTRIAQSESREMHVSLPTPTEDGLHILGLAGHYHSGNPISLNAVLVPADDIEATYRWSTKRADQADYHVVPGVDSDAVTLTAEQALNGTLVRAERLVGDTVTATSEPVTVVVDDHGAPAPQTVSISGDTVYDEGETVALTAHVAPASVLDHYQWYLTAAGSTTPQPIAGATAATYSFPAGAEHNGSVLTVAVTGENGSVTCGPSAPHALVVNPSTPSPGPVATKIIAPSVTQVYGKTAQLAVTVSPAAVGTVNVTVGSKTVSALLIDGAATLTLPPRQLKPGRHDIAVTYPGASSQFEPATLVSSVNVTKAEPIVKVKPVRSVVKRGKRATLLIAVSAAGVRPGGKVTVRIDGRPTTVKLNSKGEATVSVSLRPSTKPGRKRVAVTYAGDKYVAGATSNTTIRVIR